MIVDARDAAMLVGKRARSAQSSTGTICSLRGKKKESVQESSDIDGAECEKREVSNARRRQKCMSEERQCNEDDAWIRGYSSINTSHQPAHRAMLGPLVWKGAQGDAVGSVQGWVSTDCCDVN